MYSLKSCENDYFRVAHFAKSTFIIELRKAVCCPVKHQPTFVIVGVFANLMAIRVNALLFRDGVQCFPAVYLPGNEKVYLFAVRQCGQNPVAVFADVFLFVDG